MIELRRRYSDSKGSDSPSFSRLPAGYQEVEYLESTGTQYIDTEYYPQVDDKIYIDTIIEKIGVSWQGCRKYLDYAYFIGNNSVNNIFWMTFDDKIFSDTGFDNFNKRALFSIDRLGGYVSLNGNEEKIANWDIAESITKESEFSFILFGRFDTYGNVGLTLTHNINYLFKVERDGKVYREFIPCYRISDRKPGMYDIVNNVFYPNAGTGEFLYGPDVHYNIPPEYQEVEYLETNVVDKGVTPYINTGVIMNAQSKYRVTLDYQATGVVDNDIQFICGSYGANKQSWRLWYSEGLKIFDNNSIKDTLIGLYDKYERRLISISNEGVLINNEPANLTSITMTSEVEIGILGVKLVSGGYYALGSSQRCYSCIIEEDNIVIRNFIPCFRKADNVAGMYDLVSGEFYTNAGTGTFEIGPLVI